jgi:Spy/CpxP family protein refolding chaperone
MPGPAEAMDGDEGGHGGRLHRELAEVLYPVGLVRRYSHEIKLTQEQMKRLRELVTTTSAKVEAIKWDLESESGKLTDMVRAGEGKPKVEQQLGKVLSLENTLKTKHLSLLLDVRDALTQAQRQQLDKVKAEFFASHPGKGRRNMGPGYGRRGGGTGAPY